MGRFVWLREFISTNVGEGVAEYAFSNILKEMTKLNKGKKFLWNEKAGRAFETAKNRLSDEKIISFANFELPFILVTDASNYAVAGVLMQIQDGKQRIISCVSKTLDETQCRWSATERECFAIVFAVEKLSYFLKGPNTFTLLTDHKSLTFLDRNIFSNSKISRWQERLSNFNFILQYIEGSKNTLADMFSRPFVDYKTKTTEIPAVLGRFFNVPETKVKIYVPSWVINKLPSKIILEEEQQLSMRALLTVTNDFTQEKYISELAEIGKDQREDKNLSKIISYIESGSDPIFWKFDKNDENDIFLCKFKLKFKIDIISKVLIFQNNDIDQIVIPRSKVTHYLKITHDQSGHFGVDRVCHFLKQAWWPGKFLDIQNYIQSCDFCMKRKGNYMQRNAIPMKNLNHGTRPFEVLTIDFIHMPQSIKGKKYCVTIMDNFSRFLYIHPTVWDRAIDAVSALENFILEHGSPKIIGSDRGTHFVNEVFAHFCKNFGINHSIHTAYHPESSGNLERVHRTIKNSLWILANQTGKCWEELIPYARRAHNISFNRATKCSPHFCVYGKEPDITGLKLFSEEKLSPLEYGQKSATTLEKAFEAIKICQNQADLKQTANNLPNFKIVQIKPGDYVYVKRDQSVAAKTDHLIWIGPYKVLGVMDCIVEILKENDKKDYVHRVHVCLKINRNDNLLGDIKLPEPLSNFNQPISVKKNNIVNFRSTRNRRPTERMQIQPKKKTYN